MLLRWSVGLGCVILIDALSDGGGGGGALGPRFGILLLCRALENRSWFLRLLMTWYFFFMFRY